MKGHVKKLDPDPEVQTDDMKDMMEVGGEGSSTKSQSKEVCHQLHEVVEACMRGCLEHMQMPQRFGRAIREIWKHLTAKQDRQNETVRDVMWKHRFISACAGIFYRKWNRHINTHCEF